MQRPKLTKALDCETFLDYYYLKEELIAFCRQYSLNYSDGKIDISNRIYHYLKTGVKLRAKRKSDKRKTIDTIIIERKNLVETPFVCSQAHRAFFTSIIGTQFKFNIAFQKYLKTDDKKTYGQAIEKWYELDNYRNKNKGKNEIARQFEYNTYVRDFFANNKGYIVQDAIKCWKYKKSLPGHNKYEDNDLSALK